MGVGEEYTTPPWHPAGGPMQPPVHQRFDDALGLGCLIDMHSQPSQEQDRDSRLAIPLLADHWCCCGTAPEAVGAEWRGQVPPALAAAGVREREWVPAIERLNAAVKDNTANSCYQVCSVGVGV